MFLYLILVEVILRKTEKYTVVNSNGTRKH